MQEDETKLIICEAENRLTIRGEDNCYNSAGITLYKEDKVMTVWGAGGETAVFTKEQTEIILAALSDYFYRDDSNGR